MTESPRQLCVLVVEDEALLRWSIAETLAHRGHTVVEASSASGAVRALHETRDPIDVVLLDVRLPDSDDLGLLADVRRLRPDSAVVMMTAFRTPDVTQGALELGAYRVLDKPFDMNGLEALVIAADRDRSIH
ncbi:MAG: response regulator [Acidimicrobiia bacterium]|nr:response regulator [Acidimicrobiia bacterium]